MEITQEQLDQMIKNALNEREYFNQINLSPIPVHSHTGADTNQVAGEDLALIDSTLNDLSTLRHGLAPKAPNIIGRVLRGDGTFGTPVSTITTYTPSAASTATLLLSAGNIHHITMPAGNITIAYTNETVGQCFIVRIKQDSVGSRTVTWFSGITWTGGVAPTLSTTANYIDTFGFEVTAIATFDGFIVGQGLH